MSINNHRYFLLNKPTNMLSQFIGSKGKNCLANIKFHFTEGTHALGRLDKNSAGLLLLTTNTAITKLLYHPSKKHIRTYLVQVDNTVTIDAVEQLEKGVEIPIKGNLNWLTSPCNVKMIDEPNYLPQTKNTLSKFINYSWLQISLTEGKYHQVRKMVRAVGYVCKQLIRIQIEGIHLEDLQEGEVKEISENEFFEKLGL